MRSNGRPLYGTGLDAEAELMVMAHAPSLGQGMWPQR